MAPSRSYSCSTSCPPPGAGRADAAAGLDRGLGVGADHQVAGLEQLALPATLVEVQPPPGLLQGVGVAGEDPPAVLPRLDRVLRQPAPDRRGGRLADAALDHEPVQLSPREARDRDALIVGQLARDRLDLRELFRGENGADDPTALDPQAPQDAARETDLATGRPPSCSSPAAWRSRRCCGPRPRATPASLATPHGAGACSTLHDAQARSARTSRGRSPERSDPASPTRFAAPVMTPSNPDGIYGGDH